MSLSENESKISSEIRKSMENAMEIIYTFLVTSSWSEFFGESSIIKNNRRKTLGEIYDSRKQTDVLKSLHDT